MAQLLLIHFFLVEYVVGSRTLGPMLEKTIPFRKQLAVSWLRRVWANLSPRYKPYMSWPMKFADSLANDVEI